MDPSLIPKKPALLLVWLDISFVSTYLTLTWLEFCLAFPLSLDGSSNFTFRVAVNCFLLSCFLVSTLLLMRLANNYASVSFFSFLFFWYKISLSLSITECWQLPEFACCNSWFVSLCDLFTWFCLYKLLYLYWIITGDMICLFFVYLLSFVS